MTADLLGFFRLKIEGIRVDVTNLFNHAQFVVPLLEGGVSTTSSRFGRTFHTTSPRRIQFVLKYAF